MIVVAFEGFTFVELVAFAGGVLVLFACGCSHDLLDKALALCLDKVLHLFVAFSIKVEAAIDVGLQWFGIDGQRMVVPEHEVGVLAHLY